MDKETYSWRVVTRSCHLSGETAEEDTSCYICSVVNTVCSCKDGKHGRKRQEELASYLEPMFEGSPCWRIVLKDKIGKSVYSLSKAGLSSLRPANCRSAVFAAEYGMVCTPKGGQERENKTQCQNKKNPTDTVRKCLPMLISKCHPNCAESNLSFSLDSNSFKQETVPITRGSWATLFLTPQNFQLLTHKDWRHSVTAGYYHWILTPVIPNHCAAAL